MNESTHATTTSETAASSHRGRSRPASTSHRKPAPSPTAAPRDSVVAVVTAIITAASVQAARCQPVAQRNRQTASGSVLPSRNAKSLAPASGPAARPWWTTT